MELWAEMGEMLLPIVIAIIPVTVLVLVSAGRTTQALTSRRAAKKAVSYTHLPHLRMPLLLYRLLPVHHGRSAVLPAEPP